MKELLREIAGDRNLKLVGMGSPECEHTWVLSSTSLLLLHIG